MLHECTEDGAPGVVLDANAKAAELFGAASASDLVGQPISALITGGIGSVFWSVLKKLRRTSELKTHASLRSSDGSNFRQRVQLRIVPSGAGTSNVLWVMCEDPGKVRSQKVQTGFARLAHELSVVRTAKEAAQEILRLADQLFGWDACHLNLYQKGRNVTRAIIHVDTVNGDKREFPTPPLETPVSAMSRSVMAEGAKLILYGDVIEQAKSEPALESFGVPQLSRSLIFVPIRKGDEPFGVLSIQSYSPDAYDRDDLESLQVLADYCAGALERIIAEDQLREEKILAQAFAHLGQALSAASTPEELANVLCHSADELFGWDAIYLGVYSPEQDLLRWAFAMDTIDGERVRAPVIEVESKPSPRLKYTVEHGAQLLLRDEKQSHGLELAERFGDTRRESMSLMFAPMRLGNRPVGMLSIQSYKPKAYTQRNLEAFQALSDHCSGALFRAFAEAGLQRSEHELKKFQMAIEQDPSGVVILNARRVVEYVNPAFERLSGWTRAEVQGRERWTGRDTEVKSEGYAELRRALADGESFQGVLQMRRKDGTRYFEGKKVTPLRDESGWITHYVETGNDITVQLQAERALKDSKEQLELRVIQRTEELSRINARLLQEISVRAQAEADRERSLEILRATLESSPGGIVAVDRRGHVSITNNQWLQMWGLDANMPAARQWVDFARHARPQMQEPSAFTRFINAIKKSGEAEGRQVFVLKDDRIFECWAKPQLVEGGGGMVLAFRDITQQRRDEEALARSETIYRMAIENTLGVPYKLRFSDGQYEFMGSGLKALVGIDPAEATPAKVGALVQEYVIMDPDIKLTMPEYWDAVKRGEVTMYKVDLRIRMADGTEKWLSDSAVPVRAPGLATSVGSLGILQDISDRKLAADRERERRDQLAQTEKLVSLGTLVSGVAHEINNPNNLIMLNAPILASAWNSVRPVLQYYYEEHGDFSVGGINYSEMGNHIPKLCQGVVDGARRINAIVQELRDFARPNPDTYREQVNVNNVVRSALILLQVIIEKATDNFQLELEEHLPLVLGNMLRLEQVVINLIQNACQAVEKKSARVLVRTYLDQERGNVVIHVEDEGRGILPEHLKRITDPFFTTKRDNGGTGLGLSISSNIIHNHGGMIEFVSQPGRGTSAFVRLPPAESVEISGRIP